MENSLSNDLLYRLSNHMSLETLMRFGWLNRRYRTVTRDSELLWRAWKRMLDATKTPNVIEPQSVHAALCKYGPRNALKRWVDQWGYTNEKPKTRCDNPKHYFLETLSISYQKSSPLPVDYCRWTLSHYHNAYTRRQRKDEALHQKWREHRRLCAQLAERPWLQSEVEKMVKSDARTVKQDTLKRKYAALQAEGPADAKLEDQDDGDNDDSDDY